MRRPAASAKCLVVLSRVESQGAKQYTVGRDDADVAAGDQEVDLSVSVPGPDGDVYAAAWDLQKPNAAKPSTALKSGQDPARDGVHLSERCGPIVEDFEDDGESAFLSNKR